MGFKNTYEEDKLYIESLLDKALPESKGYNQVLFEAMRYSLLAGGKRIRPIIMLETYRLFSNDLKKIEHYLIAIEMIHTYSLIHDDLPAIDNDDLRRGKPTCHIKFGEDIAIFAGDALLNKAFELMMEAVLLDNEMKYLTGLNEIITAAGIGGIVSGQVADVLNENKDVNIELLDYINRHKTSKMLEACFTAGASIGGADIALVEKLRLVGKNLGLAFQIQDDILDVVGNDQELGKPIHSDMKNNKNTYVTLLGIDAAREKMERLYNDAISMLSDIDKDKTIFLIELIKHLKKRSN